MSWVLFAVLAACAPEDSNEREVGGTNPPGETNSDTDDSSTPECTPVDYYLDADHDGFGAGDLLSACDPVDAADVDGDCDDANADVHPDQTDGCNGVDDDCDLDLDEDGTTAEYFLDADGDGFGDAEAPTVEGCGLISGYAAVAGDCDDGNGAVSPGVDEDWTDGIDDNCDGVLEIETPVDVAEARGNSWDAPTADRTKLRIFGVYEAGAAKHEVAVTHDVPEAVILVLASYDPVNWIVTETYPGTIQRIIMSGPGAGSVSGPKDVPVDTYVGGMAWGYAYDFDDAGARTIIEKAEDLTGVPMTSFHGNYNPRSFTISPGVEWMDTSAYPDCSKKLTGKTGGVPDIGALDPTACADVLENEHICVTGQNKTITAFGLDSGASCTAATTPNSFMDSRAPSIMWSDEWVYACTGEDGMLQRASLITGDVEKTFLYCTGVASLDGQLYVFDFSSSAFGSDVPVYDTWENAQCGAPTFYADGTSNSRIAIHGGVLYSTWHSTDEFEWQVLGGTESGAVTFEDYDGWIWGIDVTDDAWLVAITEDGISSYDLDGKLLGTVESPYAEYGLGCTVQ
jgi:hypothetical protein